MELVNLNKLKRPQLIELAGHVGLVGRHRMRKRDLVRQLRKHLPALQDVLKDLRSPHPEPVESTSSSPTPPRAHTPAPPTRSFEDRGAPIPLHYGQDRLTLMVRDPFWVFAYWELEGPARENVKDRFGPHVFDGARWVLRWHSSAQTEPQNIDIQPEATNWYVRVHDDSDHFAEIGIITRQNHFVTLATSNRVHTPRSGMSDEVGNDWMTVEGDTIRRFTTEVAVSQSGAGDRLAERFNVHGLDSLFLGGSRRVTKTCLPDRQT